MVCIYTLHIFGNLSFFICHHLKTHQLNFIHCRILAGTRPYWWVNETDAYTNFTRPILRQSYLTCETSPGNPSGHVMMTASIVFFIIRNIIYQTYWCRKRLTKAMKYFIWNIYISIIGLVTISRLYFACHFSHQCLFGSYFGIAVSQMIHSQKINRTLVEMKRPKALMIGFGILFLVVCTYYGHFVFGLDPQWSIQKVFRLHYYIIWHFKVNESIILKKIFFCWNFKAFNWCKDPYYVKPETTPIFAIVRDFGLMFGLIICSPHAMRYVRMIRIHFRNIKIDSI